MDLGPPLGFNNTYALAMREPAADLAGIETISDLLDHAELSFGFSNEFMDRGDGWPGFPHEIGGRTGVLLGFGFIALPAAGLSAAKPVRPGGPRPHVVYRTLAVGGAVLAALNAAAMISWTDCRIVSGKTEPL